MTYTVQDFVWAERSQLEVHPEARVPISEEDKAALKASVEENGMIHPLVVIERKETTKGRKDEGPRFWIVDGANRFEAYPAGEKVIPCVVVQLAPGATVRDLALECASVGRSRSAGQRIMVYLERHKEKVLEAAEKGQELSKGGRSPFALSRDSATESTGFSSMEISKALGVSQKDTLLAIDLVKSHELRQGVAKREGALVEAGKKLEEGDPELAAIDEAWAGVLAGTTPIRRWKAAVGGRAKTKAVQRAETDVVKSGVECAKKFRTFGGKAWGRIPMEDRILVLDAFRKVRELVPDEVLTVLRAEWEERESASRK